MKILANSIIFNFYPICERCGKDNNIQNSGNPIKVSLEDLIYKAGCPLCRKCHHALNYEKYCEASA